MLRVGVLAVQGAFIEHEEALQRAATAAGLEIDVSEVRTPQDLAKVSGLVIPGGESTTISRLLRSSGIQSDLLARAGKNLAVFGTCAGLILISSRATHDVADKGIELLGLLDGTVDRNAFGRQRESFEANLDVAGIGSMPTVFIRAPALADTGSATVLATFEGKVVAVEQGLILGAAFHPELTPDTRMHERFLGLVQQAAA